jgi:hypothetical protein
MRIGLVNGTIDCLWEKAIVVVVVDDNANEKLIPHIHILTCELLKKGCLCKVIQLGGIKSDQAEFYWQMNVV